ncbi:hybrid sensor histidine kinase/response regulator transcription factor [Urechidicola croceus]|uniref:histidine kinase n=1 Tax=Urechidicola croceus TaxID=1850246 RepID=A0A1D8P6D3_9FLAO|nr:two-component regulator propeller domain-containing protein [Urechidicola croceus]AOW20133.1 hypothetical protein LPB138_05315 [Urechidicola croceus]
MLRAFLIVAFLYLFPQLLLGQSQVVFKKIDQSSGLSNGRVTSIVKEVNGFVWIGTKNGLNRYDGLELKIYTKKNSNLSSNDISDLLIDNNNGIWITTLGGGLNFYDRENDSFVIYKHNSDEQNSIVSNQVNTVFKDAKGVVWLGTENGLCSYDTNISKFTSFNQNTDSIQVLNKYSITSIYEDKNDKLWLGTFGNGLFMFDKQIGSFKQIIPNESQISDYINVISELNPDKLLIGTSGSGLLLVDVQTLKFSNFFKENIGVAQDINIVRSIRKDKKNNLWIGTDGNGVLEIEYPNGKNPLVHNYLYNSQLESSLSGNAVYEIMEDEYSNIWIGTAWNGVNILNKNNNNELLFSDIVGVNPTPVLSIYKNNNQLFLGLDGEGLTVYNKKLNKVQYYNDTNKTSFGAKYIQQITESNSGDFWLGTFANGLIRFNQKTGKTKQFKNDFKNDKSISYDDVRDIIEDLNGNLWIATWGGGLNFFNITNEEFFRFKENYNDVNSISSDNVIALEQDTDKIWVATFGGGLNKFDVKSRKFKHYLHTETDSTTISSNNIFSLLKDSKGNLWIGTSGDGINRMKLSTERIERFETNENIRYRTITGIIEDDYGTIWFTTKQGIVNYDYATNSFQTFPNMSGEFHINSIFKDELGYLYFGGINGVVKFNPKTIYQDTSQPQVKLTNFKLFNKDLEIGENEILKKNISLEKKVTLKHNLDVLTFEFAAFKFPFSNNCEYSIKMENFDDEWRNIGKDRTATFTNLSPGDYVFKVKSRVVGTDWGKDFTSIQIEILKPFWLKWWAFLFYGLILLSLFYAFRKYTIAWERMKSNLEFEKFSHEKDTELYNLKQQFFTNISHEIRTPVTLILSSINRLFDKGELLEKRQTNAAHTIRKNSNHLLQLVNELLDIRKFESNDIKLKISKNDFVVFCKEIFLSFSEIASDRNIEYNFEVEKEPIELFFDKNQLEKVIYNLLTNAFKFTKNGGEIKFKIENDDTNVFVIVQDSGVGISKSQLTKIFNRFYQVKNSKNDWKSGFGLGLSISKEIIELHKGTISVDSKKLKGSTFKLKLLKGKNHFSTDEILEVPPSEVQTKEINISDNLSVSQTVKNELSVLIVEDNVEIQNYLKDLLSESYQILQAYNGKEGLKIAEKKFPDLIISDVMMPIMDGIEFAKKLKLNTNTSHIPIIILTARTSIKNKMEGFETGADEYITKPFNEEFLKARIQNLLNSRKMLREKFRNEKILTPTELAINSTDQIFLDKLYTSLEKNLESNDLKANIISREIGMSHSVMYKKIKALTGLSFIEFIREYRLSIAMKLISELGYSVSEACYKVGYSDRKYFSKLFKQKFAKNPSEFNLKKNSI